MLLELAIFVPFFDLDDVLVEIMESEDSFSLASLAWHRVKGWVLRRGRDLLV